MREIALDTETTGLSPDDGHRMVEIGCVEMINHMSTGNVFHVYINPQRSMPKEAQEVHGLSEDFLKDKPVFKDVAEDFLNFIREDTLVIHNAEFDMKFINAELKMVGKEQLPMERSVDTVKMARKRFPGSPANLDALCRRFDIDLSRRTLHGALLDAELLADVYLELMGGRQSSLLGAEPEKKKSSGHSHKQEESLVTFDMGLLAGRAFPASEQELAAHKEFVSKMKEPIWQIS